jgi:hypothetical protein
MQGAAWCRLCAAAATWWRRREEGVGLLGRGPKSVLFFLCDNYVSNTSRNSNCDFTPHFQFCDFTPRLPLQLETVSVDPI